jgi:hypothetical protein
MFDPIPGGGVYEVPDNAYGFVYKCQLPPVGYGVNSITGELQETDIIKRSEIPEENYWDRYTLPGDWKMRRGIEKDRQKYDKYYYDPELEFIRGREWKRRLCGVWFHNYNPSTGDVDVLYITGTHYFYDTYWKFQGKFMDFRINDMELWYVVKYIENDPCALGLNEITKRKLGKTARLGCWLYERTSKPPYNQHAGLQSKADDDAEEVMKKAIVQPWQKLPDFFRPIYDTMKGDDPNELRFFHPSRRGSTTEQDREEDDMALESWIDFGASGEAVYDGPELDSYGSDESGKTKKPVSIKERQNTVRFCSELDGEYNRPDNRFYQRKHWYTTTVEIAPGEEDNYEFQEMTAMSNPMERDNNGRTMTGLYTYFLPAQKGMYFDRYGHPDEEKAIKYLINTRDKLQREGKLRELSSFKRKNPMSFKEAFSVDGKDSLYNPELINMQLEEIGFRTDLVEYGDLEWVDGHEFVIEKEINGRTALVPNKLIWVPNQNGEFEKVKDWWPIDPCKVYEQNGNYFPNNNHSFRIGCDPFKYDKTKSKRRSNQAAFAYQIPDPIFPSKYDDMPVLKYAKRPESTRSANYAVLKMAWLCGCEVLFERNFNKWKEHFVGWDCAAFLMWLPGEVEPGIYTDGSGTVTQHICNLTETFINEHIGKVFFKSLLIKDGGWLGFKVEDTQSSDEPMGFGFTLIAVKGKKYIRREEREKNVEDVLPYRKAG